MSLKKVLCFAVIWSIVLLSSCSRPRSPQGDQKVIILGIDAMDPILLRQYMQEGIMPNFSRLARDGSFRQLTSSIPPQSPVAWANMLTGMNAGGHGIFDFIERDPRTLALYFSTSRVEPPSHGFQIGNWFIPFGGGRAEQLRHGKAFWEFLDDYGIPNTVFRIPSNFPPVKADGYTLSGLGTPDLRGGYGTFSYYTDDVMATAGPVEGGEIIPVKVENWQVTANLIGPDNTFRTGSPPAVQPFKASIDPLEPAAEIEIQGQKFVLREGEWSAFVPVEFHLVPWLARVKGICRFFLKQAHPRFELYVSPMNLDPGEPALPISTPKSYSKKLTEEAGEFYTQGISEDTKALSVGVFNDNEYLEQAREVLAEHRRIFNAEFPKFHHGLFFFYFSSIDLNSHMFWRSIDPHSPQYDRTQAAEFGSALPGFYHQMDEVLGQILPVVDEHTLLLIISDHGFAPYDRSFNLNTWLLENGYAELRGQGNSGQGRSFSDVDWSRTQAYGIGLNGLYLNLRGRERNGIVAPGAVANALLEELKAKLLSVHDPQNHAIAITRVDRASEVYEGPYRDKGPDLIIGYNRGYRAGWNTILGDFPPEIFADNTNPWSGDHCVDYSLVPGVLLSNRKIDASDPALADMAPTILGEFGIPQPGDMIGHSLFTARPTRAEGRQ